MNPQRDQAIVLGHLLDHHPTTAADLAADFRWPPERVSAALAGLESSGVLDCRCGLIGPSEAALAFDALDLV